MFSRTGGELLGDGNSTNDRRKIREIVTFQNVRRSSNAELATILSWLAAGDLSECFECCVKKITVYSRVQRQPEENIIISCVLSDLARFSFL